MDDKVMINPCVHWCYIRYKKQYTPDCDGKCEFAKVSKENIMLKEEIERLKSRNGGSL